MPTFFKHPAFGAIMLLATFCFLFEFHDAPKTMAFAIGVGAFVWALTGFAKEKEGPDRILAAIAKIDAYHADVSSYIGRCRNSGIESTASPVESQRDLLRKEHEQLLVRGAACAVAERPGSARDMAEGIKDFLCGLGHGAEDQAKEGDSLACKGINCGCTDGRSHSNECIVEAAMIQGWAGEKEARDAFAAIKSKTFASDATADGVATQPAAAPTQADQRIEAAKDGGQYTAQLAAGALSALHVSASTTPSAQADQRIEAELVAAGLDSKKPAEAGL